MSDKTNKMLAEAYAFVEDENYSDALRLYDLVLKDEPENVDALVADLGERG